jgi:hypothetical protein
MLKESIEIGRLDFPERDILKGTHGFLPKCFYATGSRLSSRKFVPSFLR